MGGCVWVYACTESLMEEHEKEGSCLDEDFILSVLLDTARGMYYLHSPSSRKPHLLHRDLKPANILLKVRKQTTAEEVKEDETNACIRSSPPVLLLWHPTREILLTIEISQ